MLAFPPCGISRAFRIELDSDMNAKLNNARNAVGSLSKQVGMG